MLEKLNSLVDLNLKLNPKQDIIVINTSDKDLFNLDENILKNFLLNKKYKLNLSRTLTITVELPVIKKIVNFGIENQNKEIYSILNDFKFVVGALSSDGDIYLNITDILREYNIDQDNFEEMLFFIDSSKPNYKINVIKQDEDNILAEKIQSE